MRAKNTLGIKKAPTTPPKPRGSGSWGECFSLVLLTGVAIWATLASSTIEDPTLLFVSTSISLIALAICTTLLAIRFLDALSDSIERFKDKKR